MKEQADPAGTAINSSFNTNNINNNNNVIANHNQQQQQQQYSHHLHHNSKDVNHSSDTEDCDLELGSGRLVIDLEAETATTTTATTATNDDIKSTTQKSAEIQSFNSSSNNNNNAAVLSSKKSNNNNNNNLMKMNHSFSDINNSNNNNNNNNTSSVSGRGRVSYSISNMPNSSLNNNNNNNNNGGGYPSTPQVSYSTVSMNQEPSNNPTQQNKCIKMKIKRNTVAQGPHAPLSATSQLSATLHQQHSQNSPPPSSSSSSTGASLTQQQQHAAASVASCGASSSTTGNNGYQTKTTVVENSVFTYKIQHSSVNNCLTSVNSVTCKNVPLGSLPSLSSSIVAEGVRGLNHHSQHSTQGGTSYLSEGCQTTPYNSSGGMPTRSSKQPNNKRSKQSQGQHNMAVYRDSTTSTNSTNSNNNKGNIPTSQLQQQQQQQQQQLPQQHEHVPSNHPGNNNGSSSKQPFLNSASYSGMTHHPFCYDAAICPKYAPRGSHKGATSLANGQREKMTTSSDPYDFNCTTEDNSGGLLLKKLKIEKVRRNRNLLKIFFQKSIKVQRP